MRVDALSPRRLMALTGLFVAAFAAILFGKAQDEAEARRLETELRLANAAGRCAAAVNITIVTGESVRQTLRDCHPGGVAALYHFSAGDDILAVFGATSRLDLPATIGNAIELRQSGAGVVDLSRGKARAAWRPLDNGETVLVAAPANDIFQRTPPWLTYGLLLLSVALVAASLMAAFIRQSKSAALAAGAIGALQTINEALSAGRASAWRFDPKDRTVTFGRAFLGAMGLGARERRFNLSELSALVHPQDLRTALAVLSGDRAGETDGVVRLRHPHGGWSRAYLRTAPEATRLKRCGLAIELAKDRALSPADALAQNRLKDAIESIPEAFVLWDADGRLAIWNRRFASIFRMTGRSPAAGDSVGAADGGGDARPALAPGMTARDLARRAPVGGELVERYFAPDAPLEQQSVEIALGGDRWLHVSRRRTAEGGLVCVASNVTDLKRRARAQLKKERELKALVADLEASRSELSLTMCKYEEEKRRAEEANRSKSEFLAHMSHELRTPLNAINGFTEIMQSELYGPLGDPKYREYVDDILSSGQHLLELIEDILDMSKIEAGRLTLEPRRVDLERLLQECGRLVAKRARDGGVTLTVSVGHSPAAWADARAVKQITLNLLSNAIKFTPRGGEVTLTVEADLDAVTIIVADSGVGIDKEHLPRLGEPFELIEDHASKSRRGTGLGLALSKSLVEMQNGVLAIASQRNRGTVACAAFPRRKGANVRLPQFIRNEARILTAATDAEIDPAATLAPLRAAQAAAESDNPYTATARAPEAAE